MIHEISLRNIFSTVFTLTLLLSSFAAYANQNDPGINNENGLLVIDVRVQFVSDIKHDSGKDFSRGLTFEGADSYSVKNLVTGISYGGMVTGNHQNGLQVISAPEGIYCLDTIRFSIDIVYCGEPFMKIEKNRISNAGKWRFGFSNDGTRLRGSLEKMDETLVEAKQIFPEFFSSSKN